MEKELLGDWEIAVGAAAPAPPPSIAAFTAPCFFSAPLNRPLGVAAAPRSLRRARFGGCIEPVPARPLAADRALSHSPLRPCAPHCMPLAALGQGERERQGQRGGRRQQAGRGAGVRPFQRAPRRSEADGGRPGLLGESCEAAGGGDGGGVSFGLGWVQTDGRKLGSQNRGSGPLAASFCCGAGLFRAHPCKHACGWCGGPAGRHTATRLRVGER